MSLLHHYPTFMVVAFNAGGMTLTLLALTVVWRHLKRVQQHAPQAHEAAARLRRASDELVHVIAAHYGAALPNSLINGETREDRLRATAGATRTWESPDTASPRYRAPGTFERQGR